MTAAVFPMPPSLPFIITIFFTIVFIVFIIDAMTLKNSTNKKEKNHLSLKDKPFTYYY